MNYGLFIVVLLGLVGKIVSPPVDIKRKETGDVKPLPDELKDIAYMHYLQQVVQVLEEDDDFAAKVRNVSKDDIESGKVAGELQFVKHNVRTKLDELKRLELERLRAMIQMQHDADNTPTNNGQQQRVKIPKHLDLVNPHTFEIEDLQKLIKAASNDLSDLNEKRKEEFKRYEMEKEHAYREGLKNMAGEERKVAEAVHQEMLNKHKDHPEVHHPGSKQQLEQVWEDVDQLPKAEFEPKTFFRLHDIDGNGFWDESEVKALVTIEVRKMYNLSNIEDDPVEMHEEYSRMEDHIFTEADANRDGLISLPEFLDMTKKADFDQDPGWKGIDEQEIFTPEELEAYERQLAEQAAHQASPQANQQYGYQPVEGAPPSNQGVQFQPLPGPQGPGQQQQQQAHPVAEQPSNSDTSHPAQNANQPVPPVEPQPGQHPNTN